jgi:hypothetical protein
MSARKEDSILYQPVGELLNREINAGDLLRKELHIPEVLKRDITIPDVLKRDITIPEVLKREIPVGNFLSKEITFRRRKDTVDEVTCFACGNETPGTSLEVPALRCSSRPRGDRSRRARERLHQGPGEPGRHGLVKQPPTQPPAGPASSEDTRLSEEK